MNILKFLFFILVFFGVVELYGGGFDEIKFMKRINPTISDDNAKAIKNIIDENYAENETINSIFDKKELYFLIATESTFKHTAKAKNSKEHSVGLMQVSKDTFNVLKKKYTNPDILWEDLYEISNNIRFGFFVLQMKIQTVRSTFNISDKTALKYMALISYNKGMGNLKKDMIDGYVKFDDYNYVKKIYKYQ